MINCFELESQIELEEVNEIRKKLVDLPNKTPENHKISLKFHQEPLKLTSNTNDHCYLAELTFESGAKNALSGRMLSQLTDRLLELEAWIKRWPLDEPVALALLINGANGTFSSGSDLCGVRASANQLSGLELSQLMQWNCSKLASLPLISVAHVEGYALGGGAELAMAADLRVMSRK